MLQFNIILNWLYSKHKNEQFSRVKISIQILWQILENADIIKTRMYL